MPAHAVAVGSLFPAVTFTKKWCVQQLGNQWLVLRRQPNARQYQVRGVFLNEEDACLFKQVIKKKEKKAQRMRVIDGPGS
jgi:hypothetical protein